MREEVWMDAHGELIVLRWNDDLEGALFNPIIAELLKTFGAECLGEL